MSDFERNRQAYLRARKALAALWDRRCKGAWVRDQWVWVIEFRPL